MQKLLEKEIWKDIPNYEGLYRVSSLGRVISIFNRPKTKRIFRVLKYEHTRLGYLRVSLFKDKEKKKVLIHRLVAESFLTCTGAEVNHINGDKTNNCVDNLEWCTRSENVKHAFTNLGRIPSQLGRRYSKCHSSKPVNQYSLNGVFIKRWNSMTEAADFGGFSACCISFACKGKIKYHKGFLWRYSA